MTRCRSSRGKNKSKLPVFQILMTTNRSHNAEKTKCIKIVDYDPAWPVTFEALHVVLLRNLRPWVEKIEHVGSTAVPGLAAKPIIDIDIVIASKSTLPVVIGELKKLGYEHEGNLGIDDRDAFTRTSNHTPNDGRDIAWPQHHLYCCIKGGISLRNHLYFRDYLRSHPDKAAEYGGLKKLLALRYPFMPDLYVNSKTHFIVTALTDSGMPPEAAAAITKQNEKQVVL